MTTSNLNTESERNYSTHSDLSVEVKVYKSKVIGDIWNLIKYMIDKYYTRRLSKGCSKKLKWE